MITSVFIFGLSLFGVVNGYGRQDPNAKPVSFGSEKPLGEILNSDGTIRLEKGLSGSFNPQGFRLIAEPGKQPRFVPFPSTGTNRDDIPGSTEENQRPTIQAARQASSAAGAWDSRFKLAGASAGILTCVVANGLLYVGGDFTCIGDITANRIAKWNGTSWSALGPGMDNEITVLTAMGTDLYAGGYFLTAGGVSAKHIAKWNGTSWSALGSGMSQAVHALAVMGTDLYAGGYFSTADGVPANKIAKWDGTTWSALGSGLNGQVWALAVMGTDLYAGGHFLTAGGVSVNYIAKWDGTTWSALGSGMDYDVYALEVSGKDLYAGGGFWEADGVSAKHIAKWNGTSWSALGSGMNSAVYALAVMGSDLYAGGWFTTAGGVPANQIAKWNGTSWSTLGSGISNAVHALAVRGSDLYAGGYFSTAGGAPANCIAIWDADSWSSLSETAGLGVNDDIRALAVSGTTLYAGGDFTIAGGVPANHIAKLDGTTWSALGSGVQYPVQALAVSGTDLYAFESYSDSHMYLDRISKWDGSSWSELGPGMNGSVNALAVKGTTLYAGGCFKTAGGVWMNGVVKWNGSSWLELGSVMNDGTIYALAVMGSDLYAGGGFTTVGGVPANRIAKWDGTSWSALGSGMNGSVFGLAVMGSDLYAYGGFTTAGGVPANQIAKWDGTSWSALGSGINGSVQELAVMGSDLYAGGWFTTAGGVPMNNIAKWDGTSWSSLGSGTNAAVLALAASGSNLYAGGDFIIAGSKPSHHIGMWVSSGNSIWLQLNRSALVFGGSTNGSITPSQSVLITKGGTSPLTWTAASDQPWLSVTPWSGSNSGSIQIGSNAMGLAVGDHFGTVTVTAPGAVNSPQTINVLFHVYGPGSSGIPFGSFDTPIDGSTVGGSIAVSGWALDDIEVTGIKIYRNPVSGEGANLVYIGDAVFVEGARPDIESGYSNYPLNSRGGWGYLMLTNVLPNGGNGTFVLSAIATDGDGHQVALGQKTIICNNAQATKPFGAIDTPTQGGTAFGPAFINFGWTLTPMPKSIPVDGSTIMVYVDGLPLGHPLYNNYRSDIAMLFPGYANSNGAVGVYSLDTTGYSNGLHTIAWVVSDTDGAADGIGSRFFYIFNTGGGAQRPEKENESLLRIFQPEEVKISGRTGYGEEIKISRMGGISGGTSNPQESGLILSIKELKDMYSDLTNPVHVRRGYDFDRPAESINPNREGDISISIPELERVAIYLDSRHAWETREELEVRRSELLQANILQRNDLRTEIDLENNPGRNLRLGNKDDINHLDKTDRSNVGKIPSPPSRVLSLNSRYSAYLIVGSELRPLPIGSTFDAERGILYWQPGPGFLGDFNFILVDGYQNTKKNIHIRIGPK